MPGVLGGILRGMKRPIAFAALASAALSLAACAARPVPAPDYGEPFTQEAVSDDAVPAAAYPGFSALGGLPCAVVPGLRQGFVPQGLAAWDERGWLLVSGYVDGGQAALFVLDAASGTMLKALAVVAEDGKPYAGHAGGLAVGEDFGDGMAFLSGEGCVYCIPLADIALAGDRVRVRSSFRTPTAASFCACSGGTLWVGDFYQEKDYPGDESRRVVGRDGVELRAWAVGYPASSIGFGGGSEPAPAYVLALPDRVQGMAVLPGGEIALSRSYGRARDSTLSFFRSPLASAPDARVDVGGSSAPLWLLDGLALARDLAAPPMTEGLAASGGFLYVLFESGAHKYMNGSPRGRVPLDSVWRIDGGRLSDWLGRP